MAAGTRPGLHRFRNHRSVVVDEAPVVQPPLDLKLHPFLQRRSAAASSLPLQDRSPLDTNAAALPPSQKFSAHRAAAGRDDPKLPAPTSSGRDVLVIEEDGGDDLDALTARSSGLQSRKEPPPPAGPRSPDIVGGRLPFPAAKRGVVAAAVKPTSSSQAVGQSMSVPGDRKAVDQSASSQSSDDDEDPHGAPATDHKLTALLRDLAAEEAVAKQRRKDEARFYPGDH